MATCKCLQAICFSWTSIRPLQVLILFLHGAHPHHLLAIKADFDHYICTTHVNSILTDTWVLLDIQTSLRAHDFPSSSQDRGTLIEQSLTLIEKPWLPASKTTSTAIS